MSNLNQGADTVYIIVKIVCMACYQDPEWDEEKESFIFSQYYGQNTSALSLFMFSMERNQIYEQISWFMPSFIGNDRLF